MFMQQNTSQQHMTDPRTYPLTDEAMRLMEQETLLAHRWTCASCGMTYGRILPEECKNCGATALEFQYASPTEREPRA